MKINFEIECSPEEARRFLGLPDVTSVNEAYVQSLLDTMQSMSSPEKMQEILKQASPMGQMGLNLFQQMMENGVAMASGASASHRK